MQTLVYLMNKKGVELVISTTIVIILALVLLTMGVLFIRMSMCKAVLGVEAASDLGMSELQALYSEQEGNVVVKEITNEIPKQSYYGVGFSIKNEQKSTSSSFRYTVDILDLQDCDITQAEAREYIITSRTTNVNIAGGSSYADVIEFKIPKDAPSCSLKYRINVESQGVLYGSTTFSVRIKDPPFFRGLFC